MADYPSGETRSTSPFIQAMTADERREHMRQLGRRSAASRVTFSRGDAEALGSVPVDVDAMSPAQRAAWDRLWRVLLRTDPLTDRDAA